MNGKSKCKILKEIRRQIAQDNDIEYVTSECKYQGECSGTCPKCEAELRYLEQELEKRQRAGKAIAVAGIAAAMVIGATGCALEEHRESESTDEPLPEYTESQTQSTSEAPNYGIMGMPLVTEPWYEQTPENNIFP